MKMKVCAVLVLCAALYHAHYSDAVVLRGNKKALAEAAIDNKKIDDFFKPKHGESSSRKRPAPQRATGPLCPSQKCRTKMTERISGSTANRGRRYLKCPACDAFQWKGETSWCDAKGNWEGDDGDYNGPYGGFESNYNYYEYEIRPAAKKKDKNGLGQEQANR